MVENVCDKCPGNLRNPQSILSLDVFFWRIEIFYLSVRMNLIVIPNDRISHNQSLDVSVNKLLKSM